MPAVLPPLQQFLDVLNQRITPALLAAGFKPNAINAREALARMTAKYVTEPLAMARIQDDVVHPAGSGYAVPVRIYHPNPERALPVLVYFHGGGGMCGSVSVYDGIHRRLAHHSGHIVVAAEYRLAPENPYPAGQHDALTTVRGVTMLLQQNRMRFVPVIAVGGDSAGGALASAVAQQAQTDTTLAVSSLVLIYPSLDFCMRGESVRRFGEGYLLTAERMRWYFAHYFQQGEDYCAVSSLDGTLTDRHPRTLVLTAGFDPLHDEGADYVRRLQAVGASAQHLDFAALIHAFLNLEDLCPDECRHAYQAIGDFLNRGH